MIRVVLVGRADGEWKLYRQPQWMAEVRRTPEITACPRRYFDVEEPSFSRAIEAWDREGAGSGLEVAVEFLGRLGASEISPP